MCTLTYIPDNPKGFILAHNRDERIDRAISTPPLTRNIQGKSVIYPVDPEGKGTWIGISSDGRVASLLNGGSKNHERTPPYKHSRGLIIPAYFAQPGIQSFSDQYDFSGIEPFTLVALENERMYVLIWEDETLKLTEKNRGLPQIFFSYSLYPAQAIKSRTTDFYDWYLNHRDVDEMGLLDYNLRQKYELNHIQKYNTGKHILKTVSVSLITSDEKSSVFHYYDVINDIHLSSSINIEKPVQSLQNSN